MKASHFTKGDACENGRAPTTPTLARVLGTAARGDGDQTVRQMRKVLGKWVRRKGPAVIPEVLTRLAEIAGGTAAYGARVDGKLVSIGCNAKDQIAAAKVLLDYIVGPAAAVAKLASDDSDQAPVSFFFDEGKVELLINQTVRTEQPALPSSPADPIVTPTIE